MQSLHRLVSSAILAAQIPFLAVTTARADPKNEAAPTAAEEKVRDVSPDGRFAVLLTPSGNYDGLEELNSVDLVSLPSRKVLLNLAPAEPVASRIEHMIWSQDSKWFAFCSSIGPRVSDTYVYRRSGDEFVRVNSDNLVVDVKGDVRNQYICPMRWIKPGVLFLEQYSIFRDGDDAKTRFTGRYDEKSSRFRIISKKKIGSKTH